ncbi:quinon protein alcohol dehydrogenase-like superfamily [Blakeslea trispora]|nr:quinon protein alcohol dehydrogenase-like superfamily [Blakeslea trispora]
MNVLERFPKFRSYPPVPNWYSSYTTSVVEPHFFLYATRNCIVVLGLQDLRYFSSFVASNEKVTVIAAQENFCFTAGIDKTVRVWNILMGSLLTSYCEHKAEITALKVIRNGTVVISADKSGSIVIINPFDKSLKKIQHKVKSEVTSLATTVYNGHDYLAVGYANGMVFVEQIEQDLSTSNMFQLPNDNDAILSLDWQKTPSDSESWPLLAFSTKRLRNIVVWNLSSQNIWANIRLPNPPAQATEQQKSTVWIELAWSPHQRNKLFLSSYIGSIVCFDLSSPSYKLCNNERLEKHSRNVFTINWFNQGKQCITTSLDKQLIKWDVKRKSCQQILKTQGSFPYCLDSPKWNGDQIAIGMGDNAIKIWQYENTQLIMKSKKHHDYYKSDVFWRGLQGKIEKIKWHPHKEGLLAFSNEYGHIGLYDVINSRRTPCKTYHKSPGAPFIDWAADMRDALQEDDMEDTLISCGSDGMVHAYNANNVQLPCINLTERLREKNDTWFTSLELTKSKCCSMRIDHKAKYMSLGHMSGLVEIYALDNLKLVYASNYHREAIRSLDFKYTERSLLLASGCDAGLIAVHEVELVDVNSVPDVVAAHSDIKQSLNGHKKGIQDLKWSHHTDKLILASGSDDSFVIVWNIESCLPVSLFDRHRGRLLSVCWCRLNHNRLFTGSEDRFIYDWNYQDFPLTGSLPATRTLYDKERSKLNQTNANNKRKADIVSPDNPGPPVDAEAAQKKSKKAANLAKETDRRCSSMMVAQESEKSTSRLRKEQYCLILANKLSEVNDMEKVIRELKETYLKDDQKSDPTVVRYVDFWNDRVSMKQLTPSHENIHELFYGDKNDIRRLIELEVAELNKKQAVASPGTLYNVCNNAKSNYDISLAMDIMQAQFSLFEKDAFDSNSNSCLTDWIVLAMSPMVGKQKWIELMMKQAQKLENVKQYHLAASCYIACSHIYEAVELYRRQNMFQEAIALAKLRLPSEDKIIPTLFADWANELQKGEQDTMTAIWYVFFKERKKLQLTL